MASQNVRDCYTLMYGAALLYGGKSSYDSGLEPFRQQQLISKHGLEYGVSTVNLTKYIHLEDSGTNPLHALHQPGCHHSSVKTTRRARQAQTAGSRRLRFLGFRD